MKLSELAKILEETGLPVRYRAFKKDRETIPDLPWIIYYEEEKDPFEADNKVYYTNIVVSVELYTEMKDLALEEKLESLFDEHDLIYHSYDNYWDDEELYETLYELRL